jgi:hypothetical protein
VKLEHCVYNADVVQALFHRLPIRVEAENYGHAGPGKSYSLKDDSKKSKLYRKSEPVPVESHEDEGADGRRRRSFQSIRLSADEWTGYEVTSLEAKSWRAEIRALALDQPAEAEFSFNGQTQRLTLKPGAWLTLDAGPAKATPGLNRMKLQVISGTAEFDWIDIR